MIVRTLEGRPANRDSHWSTRSMAKAVGLNQTAVSRIWRAFGLKPHLVDSWKLSTDPLFIDKVRDIVGLYLDPPHGAMVLAVDEKSQMQALDRTAPMLPMMPGVAGRTTHDYVRHGTTSLFAALDVATGTVIGRIHRKHRHQEFLRFLKTIDKATPAEVDLHLVLDNYATRQMAYLVVSLPAEDAQPVDLGTWARSEWHIENRVHYVRDVTLREDAHQARTGNGPAVFATLRNTAIGYHRSNGEANIARATRRANHRPDDLIDAVTRSNPTTQ